MFPNGRLVGHRFRKAWVLKILGEDLDLALEAPARSAEAARPCARHGFRYAQETIRMVDRYPAFR